MIEHQIRKTKFWGTPRTLGTHENLGGGRLAFNKDMGPPELRLVSVIGSVFWKLALLFNNWAKTFF